MLPSVSVALALTMMLAGATKVAFLAGSTIGVVARDREAYVDRLRHGDRVASDELPLDAVGRLVREEQVTLADEAHPA